MKDKLKAIACLGLAVCMASGLWSCSNGAVQTEPESGNTTINYVYNGTYDISNLPETPLSGEQPITEIETDASGETYIVVEQPAQSSGDGVEQPRTTLKNNGRISESSEYNNNVESVSVTLPEGATMADMFAILEAKGVASFSALMNTAVNTDFSYFPLIGAQGKTGRAFALEGYLRAGTYTFVKNTAPADVISRLLRSMESFVSTPMRRQIAARNMSVDEVVIIASIVEIESGGDIAQMAKISSVIQNRLKAGMQLEMSSTGRYVDSVIKNYIKSDDPETYSKYEEYYNTFKCAGLPAGPICSPGSEAVKSAVSPLDTNYLYFCVGEDGVYRYAATAEEHRANLIAAGLAPAEPDTPSQP